MFYCSITVIYCSFSSSMISDERDVTEEGETPGKGNTCDVTDETRHIDSDITENGRDETSLKNKDKGTGGKGLGKGNGKAKGKSSMNNAHKDPSAVKEELDSEKEVKPGDFLRDERITEQDTKNGKDSSSAEIVILCSKKRTSAASTQRSLRIQKTRNEQRRELRKLDEQKSKKLAANFIFKESSVTYRLPRGYYGSFGVGETRVNADVHVVNINEDNDDNANQESDNMIVEDVSCRKKTNVLKKLKTGFLENQIIEDDKGDEGGGNKGDEGGAGKGDEGGADEGDEGGADKGDKGGVVFSDDDSDRHDDTLDNVQAALNQLDSSEMEVDAIANYGNDDGQKGGQCDGSGKHYSDESDESVKRQRVMKGMMKNLPPNMPLTCACGVVNEAFLE